MTQITPSQLVTINLKFGSHAKPLKVIAFSDLAAKALYFLSTPAAPEKVAAEMARLLGLPGIEQRLVVEALSSLREERKVRSAHGEFELTEEARKAIEEETGQAQQSLEAVLQRHFPGSIPAEKLQDWFLKAAADFFGFNGAEWVKSISQNNQAHFAKLQTVRELLNPSIRRAGLQAVENDLVDAFIGFLSSEDASDLQYVMNLGFAMFSAQLVAADTGADPVAIEEIRDSTFVLDTNTLFAIQLDAHRLANSIRALALALGEIDAKLIFLHPTKQEYTRVFAGKKNEVAALFRNFPEAVVLDAKSDFIESGKARGCQTAADFETFFDTITHPPETISADLPITEFDDEETEVVTQKADGDLPLQRSLQKHCLALRARWDKRPKSDSALRHDAALIHITESLRAENPKTWILSLDRSLQACAAERAGTHSIPAVFMLDGLIQILAVHSGGPRHNAADFAPLLTSIILNRCSPPERTYTPQDLLWLHSVHQRVSDFSPENIKKIAGIVTKFRLSGATADDKKLILAVNRAYQDAKREYDQQLADANERRAGAEKETETVRAKLEETADQLSTYQKQDARRSAGRTLLWSLVWRLPLSLLIAIVAYVLAEWALPTSVEYWLEWVASLLAFGGMVWWLVLNPIKAYRSKLQRLK